MNRHRAILGRLVYLLVLLWATAVVQSVIFYFRSCNLPPPPGAVSLSADQYVIPFLGLFVRPDRVLTESWPLGFPALLLFLCYGMVAGLWATRSRLVVLPAVTLVASLVACAAWIHTMAILPGFEWTWRSMALVCTTISSLIIATRWKWFLDDRGSRTGRGRSRGPYELGFTFVEVIVVVAILLVVAGSVIFAVRSAFQPASITREIEQERQIYVAVNLYEADFDHRSPPTLNALTSGYMPSSLLTCPTDARLPLGLPDWPANPWVNIVPPDVEEFARMRSRSIVSYFYLKTFEGRFASGRSYDEYRSMPEVGMITGVGLMQCGSCSGASCIGTCEYWWSKNPDIDKGQPAANLSGPLVTVKMDGSVTSRLMPDCGAGATGYTQDLFFDLRPPSCGRTAIVVK